MKKGWLTKTLGEVLQKTEMVNPLQSPEVEFEYIDVSSVSNATFQIEATQRLKGKDAPSRARKLVRANDILFATIRPTLQRIAIVPEHLDKQVCSTGYFVFRPKPGIEHRFVFYSLFTENFMGQMERLQKGASYPAVTDGDVKAQLIPIPPLSEQQRIVGILDEAFEFIATAKANAEKNLQNARDLLQSHLQAVFTQRSEGWTDSTIGEVIQFIDYRGKTPVKTKSGIRLITAKNVKMGYLQETPMEFIAPASYRDWMTRGIPQKGDVLFTTEAPLANVAQLDTNEKVAFAQRIIIMQPKKIKLDCTFLKYLLLSSPIQQRIRAKGTGATVQGIKASLLKLIKISFPTTLAEQNQIVEKLDALNEESQRLANLYKRKIAALEALRKSLLHQAFSSELARPAGKFVVTTFPMQVPNISTTDLHAGILAMAYALHEKNRKQNCFGHVKAEKIAHMVEASLGIDLGRSPVKDAAGPNDFPHLQKVEHRARMANYFDFKRVDGAAYKVQKLPGFQRFVNKTRTALGHRRNEIERLLQWMLPMSAQQAEIVATVFAAWNNLLLGCQQPTDEQVVFEARENWHPEKLKIPREKFFAAVQWLREQGRVPEGKGKRVEDKGK